MILIKTENSTDEDDHLLLQTGRSGQDNNSAGLSNMPVKTEPADLKN
jgi:hypothetical protein